MVKNKQFLFFVGAFLITLVISLITLLVFVPSIRRSIFAPSQEFLITRYECNEDNVNYGFGTSEIEINGISYELTSFPSDNFQENPYPTPIPEINEGESYRDAYIRGASGCGILMEAIFFKFSGNSNTIIIEGSINELDSEDQSPRPISLRVNPENEIIKTPLPLYILPYINTNNSSREYLIHQTVEQIVTDNIENSFTI